MEPTITERLAAEVAHLASKQSDTASVMQAMQADMHHLVRAVDKLAVVAEKQTELAAKMSSHGDALDRAFRQMDGNKGELALAITKLSDTLDKDRGNAIEIADTVKGYRAQLRLLYIVSGIIGFLVVTLAGLAYTQVTSSILGSINKIDVLEAKAERLRIEDNIVVAEHERRLSRLESRGDEVAP